MTLASQAEQALATASVLVIRRGTILSLPEYGAVIEMGEPGPWSARCLTRGVRYASARTVLEALLVVSQWQANGRPRAKYLALVK